MIEIKPYDKNPYTYKQSKYPHVAAVPFRSLILAPSGSGKTVLIQNLILDVYRNSFARIYIWSPSINVDSSWNPVKKYIEEEMGVNPKTEQIYFEEFHPEDMEKVIETQKKLILKQKEKKMTKLFNILICADDVADNPKFTKYSNIVNSIYIRGRHVGISSLFSVQKFNVLSTLIRTNMCELYLYKLRNQSDLDSVLDELGATVGKKTLLDIYNMATKEPHSFLYINLRATSINNMFYKNLNERIVIENND